MNEEEWLTFTTRRSVFYDVAALWERLTERRCRLFAVACCRRIWTHIPDDDSKRLIEALESVADGQVSEDEWETVCDVYQRPEGATQTEEYALSAVVTCRMDRENRLADMAADYCSVTVACSVSPLMPPQARSEEERVQCDLIRCIFGNPFHPAAFAPEWRSETAVTLASGIYEQRAFDRLPILADALEEAGCDHPDMLNHLRGPGPHARGCWVVDGVLGKI